MKKDRFKQFAKISLSITAYYFFSNLLTIPLWWGIPKPDFINQLILIPFYIDLFTWHIFGIFSLVAFIVKIIMWAKRGELFKKRALINLILHLLFTVIALGEIWWILAESF